MNRILKFENIGRSKFCGQRVLRPEITTPDEIADAAFDGARKHLVSSNVEAVYDSEKNEGTIFAGFHTVGRFSVVEKPTM